MRWIGVSDDEIDRDFGDFWLVWVVFGWPIFVISRVWFCGWWIDLDLCCLFLDRLFSGWPVSMMSWIRVLMTIWSESLWLFVLLLCRFWMTPFGVLSWIRVSNNEFVEISYGSFFWGRLLLSFDPFWTTAKVMVTNEDFVWNFFVYSVIFCGSVLFGILILFGDELKLDFRWCIDWNFFIFQVHRWGWRGIGGFWWGCPIR